VSNKRLYEVLREQGLFIIVCRQCLRDWLVEWGTRCARCGALEPQVQRHIYGQLLAGQGRAEREMVIAVRAHDPQAKDMLWADARRPQITCDPAACVRAWWYAIDCGQGSPRNAAGTSGSGPDRRGRLSYYHSLREWPEVRLADQQWLRN